MGSSISTINTKPISGIEFKNTTPISWIEFKNKYGPKNRLYLPDFLDFIIDNIYKIHKDDYGKAISYVINYISNDTLLNKIAYIMVKNNIVLNDDFNLHLFDSEVQIIKKLIDHDVKFELSGKLPRFIEGAWAINNYKKNYKILKDYYRMKNLSPALVAFNAMSIHGNNKWNRDAHFINATVNNILRKRKNLKNNNITRKGIKNLIKKGKRFNNRGYPLND